MVVAEGEQVVDEGDESGEGEGDEVQEQAPPPPRCYPCPGGSKKPWGLAPATWGRPGRSPGAPRPWKRGVGETPHFFQRRARPTSP